jgi:hypothetical protein
VTKKRYTHPDADELEVTVFGPRRGECIIIHVPNGPWFIVDSMIVSRDGQRVPVATAYLDAIRESDVYGVFVTHWHDDHTKGVADLLRTFAASLKIVGLPTAFGAREFWSFVSDLMPDSDRFKPVRDLVAVMSALKEHPLKLKERVTLRNRATLAPAGALWSLDALSPSLEDERAQIASLVALYDPRAPRNLLHPDVNASCAVLRFRSGNACVILSSDLPAGVDDNRGWRCIIRHETGNLCAQVVKIGHHGSETSFLADAWKEFSRSAKPSAVMTLFPAPGAPLPRQSDIDRYAPLCARLHMTGTHGSARTRSVTAGAAKLKDTPFSSYSRTYSGDFSSIGMVRYRMGPNDLIPRVEAFSPARRLA